VGSVAQDEDNRAFGAGLVVLYSFGEHAFGEVRAYNGEPLSSECKGAVGCSAPQRKHEAFSGQEVGYVEGARGVGDRVRACPFVDGFVPPVGL